MKIPASFVALLLFANLGLADEKNQVVIVAAGEQHQMTASPAQLAPLAGKYRQQLEALISQKEVRPVSDMRKAVEFLNTSNQLALKMNQHAELIVSKWMNVAGRLSSSGLTELLAAG